MGFDHSFRLAFVGLAAVAALGVGCSHQRTSMASFDESSTTPAASTSDNDTYLYHYYPQAQVYFCPERNLYFWPAKESWTMGQELPSKFVIDPNSRVVIPLSTDLPFRVHGSIVSMFPPAGEAASGLSSEAGSF